jgi:hypothetical protein
MIAGGFNGNSQIARRFFEGFKGAHEDLKNKLAHEMVEAMKTSQEKARAEPEFVKEETIEEEPPSLTEEELSAMAQIEDFVEDEGSGDEPLQTTPKSARAMARLARKLKAKRAGVKRNEKKEDTHGKEQAGNAVDGDEQHRSLEVPPGGVQSR